MPSPSPTPHQKPFNIAILGTGNIGSALAFHFSRAKHNITTIARPNSARLSQLTASATITTTSGLTAPIHPSSSLDPTIPYDLLIVTLLAHQFSPSLLSTINSSPITRILCLFNTFTPEDIQRALPTKDVAFGMPFLQAHLNSSGHLTANVSGAGTQPTLLSSRHLVKLFQHSGLPAKYEQNMPQWLRCHTPFCVAFEAIAILAQRRGNGASWREASVRADGVKACFGLIRALGGDVYPGLKVWVERLPTSVFAAVLWGLSRVRSFRELLATGEKECEALVEEMVAAGKRVEKRKYVDVDAILRMKPEGLQISVSLAD